MIGIKRTLNPPDKFGPVIRPDISLGQTQVQSRSVPQWNPDLEIWEWWYWTGYKVSPRGKRRDSNLDLMSYATSTDGINWEKPSLGIHEWNGSKANNIAYDPEHGYRAIYHVIRDDRSGELNSLYKGLFGFEDKELRVSPNGFDWTSLNTSSIPTGDESHFLFDNSIGKYLALVKKHTAWGRSVWITSSLNFKDWDEPKLVMHSDKVDQENRFNRVQNAIDDPNYLSPPLVDSVDRIAEVYQMAVMPYEGLYLGFPVLFNPASAVPEPYGNYTAINQVELTVSRDLYNWQRVADRGVFIGIDPWDGINYGTSQNLLCGEPFIHDHKEIWIYYNALRFRGPMEFYDNQYHPYIDDASALCVAKLRLDGFVSLYAQGEGEIISKPFEITEGELFVNVNAAAGQLRAEVLDANTMMPISGLKISQCDFVTEDNINLRVNWSGKTQIKVENPVRIRFQLNDAKLYAFWIKQIER